MATASNIVALMQTAHEFGGKAVPVIVFETDEGRVKFYRQTERSKSPGSISMNNGAARSSDIWFGSIDKKTGAVRATRECPEWVKVLIFEFDKDPAHFAANYGHGTKRCCFCAMEITTSESLAVGYGPVCAKRYGLPWGAKSAPERVDAIVSDPSDPRVEDDFADFPLSTTDPLATLEAASEVGSTKAEQWDRDLYERMAKAAREAGSLEEAAEAIKKQFLFYSYGGKK